MVQAFPGTYIFNCIFCRRNGIEGYGTSFSAVGCMIGSVGIFLPSLLLVIFFYPIWNNLKKHVIVFRAMEGINAVVVGIMIAATILAVYVHSW